MKRSLPLLLAAAFGIAAGCAATVEEDTAPEPVVSAPDPTAPEVTPPAPPPEVAVAPPMVEPPPQPIAAPESPVNEVERLLAEFGRLRRLPPAELPREQEAARQAFNTSRSDAARVRLAMALAMPPAGANEELRALELLDPLVKTPGATLHGIAFLLASYLQEQRRLASQLQALQQNVQGLQQNAQALQQKLDALKSLERSLSQRESAGQRRR